jgi:hypothetical protein
MKIAICLPCHGRPTIGFTCSLARMQYFTALQRPDIETGLFTTGSSRIHAARNKLIEQGLAWGADWIFMQDCDHSFPEDALLRLLAMRVPVAGINQPTREDNPKPTATALNGSMSFTTRERGEAGLVEEVQRTGAAMLLVSRLALEKIGPPWFAFPMDREIGEDYFFCERVREAGIPIFVHHGVSWETGHAHEVLLTNEQVAGQFVSTRRRA